MSINSKGRVLTLCNNKLFIMTDKVGHDTNHKNRLSLSSCTDIAGCNPEPIIETKIKPILWSENVTLIASWSFSFFVD